MTLNERIHAALGKPLKCHGPFLLPTGGLKECQTCDQLVFEWHTEHDAPIPAYDTDPVASHALRSEMRKRGWRLLLSDNNNGCAAMWWDAQTGSSQTAASSDTELEAVAKAAARALEGK